MFTALTGARGVGHRVDTENKMRGLPGYIYIVKTSHRLSCATTLSAVEPW